MVGEGEGEGEGEFRAALQEWRPLLELLLQPSTWSPVGAASHWLRSHGCSASVSSSHRTCRASRLWRLVPHLLSSRVALLHRYAFVERNDSHQQLEKSEEDEPSVSKKRNRTTIGNCMWIQTLPSMAQINILGFLDVEHALFHVKDLELLTLDLLSGIELNFWVTRAAEKLLNKVGCSNNCNQEQQMKQYTLPSWLLNYKNQPPVLPWMPVTLSLQTSTRKLNSQEELNLGLDKSRHIQEVNVPTKEGSCHGKEKIRQEEEDDITGLQTPPHHSEGHKTTSEGWLLDSAVLSAQDEEKCSVTSNKSLEAVQQDPKDFKEEGSSFSALAHSLREAWLERQPALEDIHKFSTLPDATMFFKFLKPWEMKDDTVLSIIKVSLGKDSGFVWSAQILSYCLLPKLVLLEQPASRFLVSAAIEAGKVHPRAVIDALLMPLVLSEGGSSKVQCDVMNRMLKECLSDNHVLSFCGKMFLSNRRQQLPFPNPPLVRENFLSTSVIWTEPAWVVLQNLLSRPIELDKELLEALLNSCGEEVAKFAKSLKFCNLLLCLLSKYGSCLKPYKSKLQMISEQTETFISKALMAKCAAL